MSTKTTFKRISLVTVAALGFGVLSVVPSHAGEHAGYAFTAVPTAATPAIGSAVTLPIKVANDGDGSSTAGTTGILTATITTKPTNSIVANESITSTLAIATTDTSTAGSTLETVTANAVKLTSKTGTNVQTAETATVFAFTPDVPGYYVVTLTKSGTGTNTIDGGAGPVTYGINVTGANIVQGATGLGTASGTQVTGRQAAVAFTLPSGSTTSDRYEISSTGAGIVGIFTASDVTNAASATTFTVTTGITKKNGTDYTAGATFAGQSATTKVIASASAHTDGFVVTVNSAVDATAVISVKSVNGTTGELTAVSSATIKFGPAVVVDKKADTTSTSWIAAGAAIPEGADSATVTSLKTTGLRAATILVTQKNATSTADETLTAVITGPGTLATQASVGALTATGARAVSVLKGEYIAVYGDGSTGVGTITISTPSGVVLGVETVSFFDNKPSTVTATVKKAYILASTASVAGVFSVVVKDPLGNAITGTNVAVTAAPTDTTTAQVVGGAATCAWSATSVAYLCSVAGLSATKFGKVNYTITATGTDLAATAVKTTADVTFSAGVAAKVTLTGPATGSPGEIVSYTLTMTDANGYPVADQSYNGGSANGSTGGAIFGDASVISGFTAFTNSTYTDTITAVSGVATLKGTLPTAGSGKATFTLAGTGLGSGVSTDAIATALEATTLVVTTEVVNPAIDAAAAAAEEATAAANDATDAALSAAEAAEAATAMAQEAVDAVAELSASVTKLISALRAQITTLTNLVVKIQKKVRA